MLAEDGRLTPSRYWPNLEVLCSWKGPGVKAFIERCRAWYGDLPFRDVGYGSSEFRTGLALSDDGSPNVPLPDNYFYEFIPEDDRVAYLNGAKTPLLLHELEPGRRYLILQTGPHGLYRYNIEDIVEVNGFCGRTPTIHFVQKARMVTSITGEKIYESQVIEAMDRVAARRPDLKPAFFVCYADIEDANYKLCVEFDSPRCGDDLRDLLRLFERCLGEVNIEYPYKRASLRLKDPQIFQLDRGASVRFIQYIGSNAVMDNQAKIPRLSRDVDAHFEVFGLSRGGLQSACRRRLGRCDSVTGFVWRPVAPLDSGPRSWAPESRRLVSDRRRTAGGTGSGGLRTRPSGLRPLDFPRGDIGNFHQWFADLADVVCLAAEEYPDTQCTWWGTASGPTLPSASC